MAINHAQLRAFHAVAGHGTFTQAARAMHVTRPTLSDHGRGLKSRCAAQLFERLTGLSEALLDIPRRLSRCTCRARGCESPLIRAAIQ